MKCSLGISNFLEQISSLSYSVVFLCFFALITEEGFLISPGYSLELCIQMGISFLLSFAFHFFSQLFVRPPQTTILPFFILGMVLITITCTISWTSIHSSSGTLSHLTPWIYLSLPLYARDLIKVIAEWYSGFPYFLQFKSEFGNKQFMIWATVRSRFSFCWLYRASPSLTAKNIANLKSVLTIWWCPCVNPRSWW